MAEEDLPTYVAGDTIRFNARIEVRDTMHGPRRITAVFIPEGDSIETRAITLSGIPSPPRARIVDVELTGLVVADAPGVYRCSAMTVEYPGPRSAQVSEVPDTRFRIAEEEISEPGFSSWHWLPDE